MSKEMNFNFFRKIFIWFAGLSSDLLFWVAIDTLFLTLVKGFTASEIVSINAIALIVNIAVQFFCLKIIKRIGNTNSVRLGMFLFLLSSVIITFGPSYFWVLLGKIVYSVSLIFKNIENVVLKNNLRILGKDDEYIPIKSQSNVVYAVATMIIALIAGFLFNVNNYLPMYLCIFFAFLCFVLSFFIIDYSGNDKVVVSEKKEKIKKVSLGLILIFLSYGIFYPLIDSGQTNVKLFIQEELFLYFNASKVAILLSIIVFGSRVVRVFSNLFFSKVYGKYKDKVINMFSVLIVSAFLFTVIGTFMDFSLIFKFSLMALGYFCILIARDPFREYMQNLAMDNVDKTNQSQVIVYITLTRQIGNAILSFLITIVLLGNSLLVAMYIFLFLSLIEVFIGYKLYKLVR